MPTETLVLNNPAISLEINITNIVPLKAKIIFAINSAIQFISNNGFRPNLSERPPQKGETKN